MCKCLCVNVLVFVLFVCKSVSVLFVCKSVSV
ncbi:hypothetical protein QTP70_023130, partial [Hemibagrus guttatus]